MLQPVYFSQRVINTLNALPGDDRNTLSAALTSEFVLGESVIESLNPIQKMVYAILRSYVSSDQRRLGGIHEVFDLRDL